jgi:hypothetical protein
LGNVKSVFKRTFHNNTQKGGGKGGSSKLKPVFYRLSTSMLWRYQILDGFFEHIGFQDKPEFDFGKIKPTPCSNKVNDAKFMAFSNTIFSFLGENDYEDLLETIDGEVVSEETGKTILTMRM